MVSKSYRISCANRPLSLCFIESISCIISSRCSLYLRSSRKSSLSIWRNFWIFSSSIKQRDRGRFAQDIRELLDNIGDRRIYELLKGTEHQTLEILLLSTWGYSGREIAKIMGLAEQTVYTKRNRLKNKLKNLLKIE